MWKDKTIFQKMFLGTMFLIVVTLMCYYGFLVYYEYKDNTETAVEETEELSEKVNAALKDYISNVDGTITAFYYELFQNKESALAKLLLSEKELSIEEQITQKYALEKYFSQLFLMRGDVLDTYIYRNEENNYLYSPYARKKMEYSIEESEWYQETLRKAGKTSISINYLPEYIDYKKPVIGFSRMLKDVGSQGIVKNTVVRLEFTMKNLDNLVDNYITNDMTTILLVDDQGNIVYQRGAEVESQNRIIDDEKYIICNSSEKVYEWHVMIATDKEYILMRTKDYLKFTVGIGFLLILVAAAVCYLFAGKLCSPIIMLKNGMENIQAGNFDVRIGKQTNDELGSLVDDFNQMAYKIKTLIKENYEEEIQKKDAQYKYLQAQIDPHFIFNTLQIISSMAIVNQVTEIETISNSLAQLIRYSISGEQKTISLVEEIKNVTNYLEIQKIRFKNRLSYEIHMDFEPGETKIIKLVLQPIVENAIQHGFCKKTAGGKIEVHVFEEKDKVFIDIYDNGIGMNENEVEKLMEEINAPLRKNAAERILADEERTLQEQGNHVGLRNINLRLKMFYGEDYGIVMKSTPGQGTTVKVCIRRE